MTPAIQALNQAGIDHIVHEYDHDPTNTAFGDEAAIAIGVDAVRIFKTLVVRLDNGNHLVAVVPVSGRLNLKQIAMLKACKRAKMADPIDAERLTGYVIGGVSPLGQKRNLPTFIDVSAKSFTTIFVSGGKRGIEVELSPFDLEVLTEGRFEPICD